MKKLIITADDFGMSESFNEIILELASLNVINAISVLVTRNLAKQKTQIKQLLDLRKKHKTTLGLHFECLPNKSYKNVYDKLTKQYTLFVKLLGMKPERLDKHKQIYTDEEAKAIADFAKKNKLMVRKSSNLKFNQLAKKQLLSEKTFFVTDHSLKETKDFVKARDDEISELVAHPGKYDSSCKSSLNKEREKDYKILTKLGKELTKLKVDLVSL